MSAVAAALVAASVAAGLYYLGRPDGDGRGSGAVGTALPSGAMLVRMDTAPGWPKECHADLGLYKPGDPSPSPLVTGPQCDILPERSPDKTRIAFTRQYARTAEAWVVNADGGSPRKVTAIARGTRVTWSPDGTRLAYVAEKDGVRQLFANTLDGRSATQLTTDASLKDDPMWSSTNRIVFWSRQTGDEQIYSLDPADPGSPWTRLTKDGVRSVDPEWSPDGRRIAFTRGPDEHSTIWVMNADGTGLRALTTGTEDDMDPAWSRDGSWLCYVRGPVGNPVIRAVRADGSDDRSLTPSGHTLGHPYWL
ncbi:hypothetical protein E1264_40165 [Actinomadura sp. KC216]|nr:hypothetical protein E1264_40165 [Actinomadura sp. KC216]